MSRIQKQDYSNDQNKKDNCQNDFSYKMNRGVCSRDANLGVSGVILRAAFPNQVDAVYHRVTFSLST